MVFHALGPTALAVLQDISSKRVGARNDGLVIENSGEIERVAWLRATDQKRRLDASLLTENFEDNWSVRAQAYERNRQEDLLKRMRSPKRRF